MSFMHPLVGAKQFDGVLGSRQRMPPNPQSPHFALHFAMRPSIQTPDTKLRLGFIVAKKLSKRACRRNLIRRIWKAEIYQVLKPALNTSQGVELDIVVRQKAAFNGAQFISANSNQLKTQIQQEVRALLRLWLQQAAVQPYRSSIPDVS